MAWFFKTHKQTDKQNIYTAQSVTKITVGNLFYREVGVEAGRGGILPYKLWLYIAAERIGGMQTHIFYDVLSLQNTDIIQLYTVNKMWFCFIIASLVYLDNLLFFKNL